MDTPKLTTKDFFKTLQIIHFVLMTGLVIFAMFAFYFHYVGLELEGGKELNFGLIYTVPIFAIAGTLASNLVFKQKLKDCINKTSLKEKLTYYRSALIIKFAIIEGCAFFAIIGYLLTGKLVYLGILGLLLIVFMVYKPTKEKSIVDLELNQAERQLIYDSKAIIA